MKPPAKLPLSPLLLATVTVTAPALPAGVVAVICVPLTTTTFVATVPPNVTVAPATKFVPVIVTAVPPAWGPLFGATLLTVGDAMYVNALGRLPLCPPGLVTVTAVVPALLAGVVAVICVPLSTTTFVAATLPNATFAPAAKLAPVIVTAVPPVVGPLFGRDAAHCRHRTCDRRERNHLHDPGTGGTQSSRRAVAAGRRHHLVLCNIPVRTGDDPSREPRPCPRGAVWPPCSPQRSTHSPLVVVAAPLLALVPLPLAPAVTSNVVTPRYSRIRTSGYAAAWLNVTVTVLLPPAMLLK